MAHADLYGYVDADGNVHLANEKLDERYQLFVKGETKTEFKLSSELKYLPATSKLEDHIIYKRIQKTPNVKKFEPLIAEAAKKVKLDVALVKAVIAVESAYDPQAVSPKGATGLMQLIPGTAERYGVKKIADPQENISGGTRYLRDLLEMFKGDLTLALAGYNAGEGAVIRYKNKVPPFPETQSYVKLVMQFYEHFGGGARGKVSKGNDGRIRVLIPGRRNLPPDGNNPLMREGGAVLPGPPGALSPAGASGASGPAVVSPAAGPAAASPSAASADGAAR
jgi:hypothetical protein